MARRTEQKKGGLTAAAPCLEPLDTSPSKTIVLLSGAPLLHQELAFWQPVLLSLLSQRHREDLMSMIQVRDAEQSVVVGGASYARGSSSEGQESLATLEPTCYLRYCSSSDPIDLVVSWRS
jgi:hypothetical protein